MKINMLDRVIDRIVVRGALASLMALLSCTAVEYGYIDTGNGDVDKMESSKVVFSFDWSNVGVLKDNSGSKNENVTDASSVPQMYVAMSRIVNEVHYVYLYDPSAEEQYDISVHSGDYYLAAFGCRDDADTYIYDNLQKFESDNSLGMRNLYARVPRMGEDEFYEQFENLSVYFNPSYPIIREASPLFVDVKKMSLYGQENPVEILFKPLDLTMTIVFRVRVNIRDTKDEPVEIKNISAEISGVPAKIQLMSGIITEDELCKVPFRMEQKSEVSNGTAANGVRSRQAVFEGSVRVFGLFASKYGTYISGPGILRLAVNAVAGKDENAGGSVSQTGNSLQAKAVERIFYTGINLKKVIEEAKPVVRSDKGTGYRAIHVVRYSDGSGFSSAGNKPIIIEVPDALNVTKDNVVSGGGGGLEKWFESDRDISTEV